MFRRLFCDCVLKLVGMKSSCDGYPSVVKITTNVATPENLM